jgi:NAD(P)-dependent dehydrogenase (short-subunit alcohol dehydrogenase family)
MVDQPQRFDGRVVLVTGGARGIGEATVRRFAAEGAIVVLVDINIDGAAAVAGSEIDAGHRVDVCIADIGTEAGWDTVATYLRDTHGTVEVVVNNATGPAVGPVLSISEHGWQQTFDTNVTAVWRSAKALVPLMTNGGAMVNLSSNAAIRATPGLGAYGAAKAAVISLTRSLAVELAPSRIRANSITPGVILSPMIQQTVDQVGRERFERGLGTRCGATEELASVVVFLASDDASYVNGENITVDGGWFAGASASSLSFGGA